MVVLPQNLDSTTGISQHPRVGRAPTSPRARGRESATWLDWGRSLLGRRRFRAGDRRLDGLWRLFVKNRWAMTTALAAALMVGTSGCTFGAAIATKIPYSPSDGTGTVVGDIAVRNALLITDDGDRLNLVVSLVNRGEADRAVTVQWEGASGRESERILVDGNDTAQLGGPDEPQIIIEGVDVTPGSLYPV